MPGRLGPRFALETGFLILLAVLAGLANLSWPAIVLVMGAAWMLVTIHEVARSKEGPRLPAPIPRSYSSWTPGPAAPPVDDITRVIRVEEPEPEPRPEVEPEQAQAQLDLEADLRPTADEPRRRWGRRAVPVAETPEPLPQPRHVRVLPNDSEEES